MSPRTNKEINVLLKALSAQASKVKDWELISSFLQENGYSRTPSACEAYWGLEIRGHGKDLELAGPQWTDAESKLLLRMTKAQDDKDKDLPGSSKMPYSQLFKKVSKALADLNYTRDPNACYAFWRRRKFHYAIAPSDIQDTEIQSPADSITVDCESDKEGRLPIQKPDDGQPEADGNRTLRKVHRSLRKAKVVLSTVEKIDTSFRFTPQQREKLENAVLNNGKNPNKARRIELAKEMDIREETIHNWYTTRMRNINRGREPDSRRTNVERSVTQADPNYDSIPTPRSTNNDHRAAPARKSLRKRHYRVDDTSRTPRSPKKMRYNDDQISYSEDEAQNLREASDIAFDNSFFSGSNDDLHVNDDLHDNDDLHGNEDLYGASPPRQNFDQYGAEKPDEEETMSEHPHQATASGESPSTQLHHEGSGHEVLRLTVASSRATATHELRPENVVSDLVAHSPVTTACSNNGLLVASHRINQNEDESNRFPSPVAVNGDFPNLAPSLSTPLETEMKRQAKELSKRLVPKIEEEIGINKLNIETSEASLLRINQVKQNIKEEDEKSQKKEDEEEARSIRILDKIKKSRKMRLERDEQLRMKEIKELEILKVNKQNLVKKEAALLAHQSIVNVYDSD